MRFMWLWLLLYGLVAGAALFGLGLALTLGFAFGYSGGPGGDVGGFGSGLALFTSAGGFLALVAGMILLLIRRTVAAGRVVSVVGIGLYHVAALGVVAATSVVWVVSGFGSNIILVYAIVAVMVVLPGVFIFLRLRRAQ
jgi:hypothetical protein